MTVYTAPPLIFSGRCLFTWGMSGKQDVCQETWFGEFSGGSVLELHPFTAEGPGLIPGQGTKILKAWRCSRKEKKKGRKKLSLRHIKFVPFNDEGQATWILTKSM